MNQPSWIGHTLGGRYKLETLLGQGGMSAVYKATDPNLRRMVAIKLIHSHLANDPEFVRRFEEEAAAVAQLRHPNIIQVFDFNHDGDVYYMVLEFIPGETLHDKLRALNGAGRRMPLSEVTQITGSLCQAVGYAHERGMIHRDLKPANVMITPQGQTVLMDFGIVKMLGGNTHTATGAMIGTVAYMSPEQIRGQRPDHRADIYALGIMLFEMVSGQRPFQGDSAPATMMMHLSEPVPDIRQLNSTTPPAVVAVIEKALAKDPAARFQTAAEMAAGLTTMVSPAMLQSRDTTRSDSSATSAATVVETAAIPAPPASGLHTPPPPSTGQTATATGARPWLIGGGVVGIAGVIILVCGLLFVASQLFGSNGNGLSGESLTATALVDLRVAELSTSEAELAALPAPEEPTVETRDIPTLAASPTGEATATSTAAVPSTTETSTPTPTSQPTATATPPPPSPTAVPPAATATPTAVPTAATPFIRITQISLSSDGQRYEVYYEATAFTPHIGPADNLHIHFFFNTVAPANAGVPGSGPWQLYDLPIPFTRYGPGDRPQSATQMCALVANHDHSIRLGSGNCVNLP